jgi:signal peptidase I
MFGGENLLSDQSVDGESVDVEAMGGTQGGTAREASAPAAGHSAGLAGESGGAEAGDQAAAATVTANASDTAAVPDTADAARGNGLASWVRDVLVSVAVSAFIITFLYQPVRVEGTSMLPMLQNQDRLFINKMAYRVGEIHRGDVVVFLYPHDHTKSYIKRVIAVGGDELRIDHGQVYVNGKALEESYVPPRFTDDRSQPEMVVPPHAYFVMGDHRSISSDSRDFGPVEGDLIYGKAAFVYWPIEQIGVVR